MIIIFWRGVAVSDCLVIINLNAGNSEQAFVFTTDPLKLLSYGQK